MNHSIKEAGELKQQLEADIANMLNTHAATLARGTEPVSYTVSVEVKM